MSCAHCQESVARSLEELDGVVADVSLNEGRALVSMETELGDAELSDAVVRAGFSVVRIEPAGKDGAS
ncbi:MAG: heavy-metal-associated domain-containing protein [Treponemataceae bacterium]|nr:heavy-metal-associated domain-containing protein [Treponemataceae bacterium]